MTTEPEAREIWKAIEDFQKKDNDERAIQQKADSDARRATAIDYIKTLDLNIDKKLTTPEQKAKRYDNISLLKNELANTSINELKSELLKIIENEMVEINKLKDQQRMEKIGS